MTLPSGQAPFDCVEVRFKNGRKEFFRNHENLTLSIGDIVATESSPGHDIGIITLTGELVKVQMKKKSVKHDSPEIPKIYRKANQKDIDTWQAARDREEPMKVRAREIAIALNLEMKISDIEFQGDASKATFYYTANDRVDFRQLIKDFAREFSIRIEMKQVGFRQEASRLGGIGSCGRELCCSTWLTDFRSVNTAAARYQQLSLNPQKLAGQCGKLKCCLNYELDTYMDALKEFPDFDTKLETEKGNATCQKQDIFKGLMWFSYQDDPIHWHTIRVEQVKEIIAENKQKIKVSSLEDYAEEAAPEKEKEFSNVVGQESLTRFDQPKRKKSRNNKNKNKSAATADVVTEKRPNPNKPQKFGDRNNANNSGENRQGQFKKHDKNGPRPEGKPSLKNENHQEIKEGNRPEKRFDKPKTNPNQSGQNQQQNPATNTNNPNSGENPNKENKKKRHPRNKNKGEGKPQNGPKPQRPEGDNSQSKPNA